MTNVYSGRDRFPSIWSEVRPWRASGRGALVAGAGEQEDAVGAEAAVIAWRKH
jgi:hypothetical protein